MTVRAGLAGGPSEALFSKADRLNSLNSAAQKIDAINDWIGRVTALAALLMVIIQFVVVMRYVFGVGSIMMQESVIYLHAILFMIGAGYTLLYGGHVRVDIFYRDASARGKAILDLIGIAVFLLPVCILIWWFSWRYVGASWAVFEGSKETSGIQAVFLLKSTILAFAALMGLQGISLAIHSILVLIGAEPPVEQSAP